MAGRWRLGVVLLSPDAVAAEVDGLRRACGDGAIDRVPPHITLVPPVNVREDDVPAAVAVLRSAAARAAPLELTIGPVATFAPPTHPCCTWPSAATSTACGCCATGCSSALWRAPHLAVRPPRHDRGGDGAGADHGRHRRRWPTTGPRSSSTGPCCCGRVARGAGSRSPTWSSARRSSSPAAGCPSSCACRGRVSRRQPCCSSRRRCRRRREPSPSS